jgi:hypothetical protein
MKIFYFMGRNENNKSGVSWKLWKIERDRRRVCVWWGPIAVIKRRVIPTGRLQHKCWTFRSGAEATLFEIRRIHSKEIGGYERKPRWRSK